MPYFQSGTTIPPSVSTLKIDKNVAGDALSFTAATSQNLSCSAFFPAVTPFTARSTAHFDHISDSLMPCGIDDMILDVVNHQFYKRSSPKKLEANTKPSKVSKKCSKDAAFKKARKNLEANAKQSKSCTKKSPIDVALKKSGTYARRSVGVLSKGMLKKESCAIGYLEEHQFIGNN